MQRDKKVLLAFSGGIDSCYAAGVLRAQGYEVHALTMDMTGDRAITDKAEAKARELGIAYEAIDVRDDFAQKIIGYFTSEYLCGRTPAPCTLCNYHIKWRYLYEYATRNGFDRIATGHYFRIAEEDGRFYVAKAADALKDQSYYLWQLPQHILAMALTPMGDRIKSEVKQALPRTESRKESMGVCFLQGRSCRDFLAERCGSKIERGNIMDKNGEVIGRHDGTPYYTIGQKKGLGLPAGQCVVAIDARANALTAGTDGDLHHSTLVVADYNVVDMGELTSASDISVKIRGLGRNPDGFCKVAAEGGTLRISLGNPAWACAAGQPVVLYRGEKVVGGGILEEYL